MGDGSAGPVCPTCGLKMARDCAETVASQALCKFNAATEWKRRGLPGPSESSVQEAMDAVRPFYGDGEVDRFLADPSLKRFTEGHISGENIADYLRGVAFAPGLINPAILLQIANVLEQPKRGRPLDAPGQKAENYLFLAKLDEIMRELGADTLTGEVLERAVKTPLSLPGQLPVQTLGNSPEAIRKRYYRITRGMSRI